MSKADLCATWLKGRIVSRGADTAAIIPDPMAVHVRAPNKLPPFPSQVKVIAIVKQSHFHKPARPRVKPSSRPRNWGNVENLEMDYRDATLAAVEELCVPLPSPTTDIPTLTTSGGGPRPDIVAYYIHASEVFLSNFNFSDREIVWFRGAQAFPLTEVYLEHINEGRKLDEATCEQLVQHLRGRCSQSKVLAKQDSLFACKLPSEDTDSLALSIGSAHPHSFQPPLPRSHAPHTLLTFQVIMSAPLCQGLITMDTEIHVIPSEAVDSPELFSPDESPAGLPVSGVYHLETGLQTRGNTRSSSDRDSSRKKEEAVRSPSPRSPSPRHSNTESIAGAMDPLPLSPANPPTNMTVKGGGIGLLSPLGEPVKPPTYSIEVRPFYREGLDKNMLLVPRALTSTLHAWIGPVCSGDYLALYPADGAGVRLFAGVPQNAKSRKIPTREPPIAPYHVVVKLFSPTSDLRGKSLGSSLSSESMSSIASQNSEEYPVVPEGEWLVVFLHPETLFSIFGGPFLPGTLATPLYVSMELVHPAQILNITKVDLAFIASVNNPVSEEDSKDPLIYYIIEPRCLCQGEVFSLVMKERRGYFKVMHLYHNKTAILVGTTSEGINIYLSDIPTHSFIPDMSYLDWFAPKRSFSSYWYCSPQPGLEMAYNKLLSCCLSLAKKGHSGLNLRYQTILLSGPSGCGKMTVVESVARLCGLHVVVCNPIGTTGVKDSVSGSIADAEASCPCVLVIRGVHGLNMSSSAEPNTALHLSRLLEVLPTITEYHQELPVLVIGTTDRPSDIPAKTLSLFIHRIEIDAPTLEERRGMIEALGQGANVARDVDFDKLAQSSPGMVLSDFVSVLARAAHKAKRAGIQHAYGASGPVLGWQAEQDLAIGGVTLSQTHLLSAIEEMQSEHGQIAGAPKIPSVEWDDVGGLGEAKQEILDTIQLPLQHPELFAGNLHRSGILLYGAPGTGKTLLAKAVATECSLNFMSVKGPELLNQYVGQSEHNIREIFSTARSAAPCVVFFDELDSVAPNRGRSGDSGGVMDRVVSQLLSELDGLQKSSKQQVFVIGATNRPDLLDSALLRPGRFDRLVYLPVSEEVGPKVKILQAITRKLHLHRDVDLQCIAERSPKNTTGADMYALCNAAFMRALEREVHHLEQPGVVYDEDSPADIVVLQEDFLVALKELEPSVSSDDLKKYDKLRHFHKQS